MEKLVFADSFKKTIKGLLKVPTVIIDDPIFRLHYKFTALALLCFSILISCTQFFGDPIMCIQKDDIPEQLLNTYCWIEGTFTLPKALSKKVGVEIVYPGVEKYQEGDEVIEHAYYQWVCFVLFLQALLFCIPHIMWKILEGGKLRTLIQQLRNPAIDDEDRQGNYQSLSKYIGLRRNQHNAYAMKFLMCEFFNFVIVVGQIYFIDKFLGGQFTKFGHEVVKFANEEQENRTDPMIRVFPRITKCTFHRYGSSGDVQKHDALCLLPLNILNEKIFIIMWFWFVILAALGGITLIYRLVACLSGKARFRLLNGVASLTPKDDIGALVPTCDYGDWFLLYLLADNVDDMHFRELVLSLQHPETYFQKEKIMDYSIDHSVRKDALDNKDFDFIFKPAPKENAELKKMVKKAVKKAM